ncbi:MAG: hypothetical protein E7220_00440 [Clostridiales bacterium]|nr:hypothetical protein [Clostridiales bacterium]
MAGRKNEISQNRREAIAWAEDWAIRRRNRKIITVFVTIAAVIAIAMIINFIVIASTRMTFSSEEEMRAALQGRYIFGKYEDIVIEGDDITLTYFEITHYDLDYAEEYGYSEYDDSVYEDVVEEWDYRHGVIKCKWMEDITVDKEGRLRYYNEDFEKTDKPKPVPIDKSLLDKSDNKTDADTEGDEGMNEEALEEQEEVQDNLDATQESALEAGILDAVDGEE